MDVVAVEEELEHLEASRVELLAYMDVFYVLIIFWIEN